jgi:hypothetical protein
MSIISTYGVPYLPATEEANDGNDYTDILTGVTDADEVYAEQCEAAATTRSLMRSLGCFDSFDLVSKDIDGPSSTTKIQMRSSATLESIQKDEQLVCASFWGASEYAELLFDAETLLSSDEDLALRSIFAPGSTPEPVTHLVARTQEKRLPTPELLDTSYLRIQATLAVHAFCGHVSETLDFDVSPVIEKVQDVASDSTPRRRGRSLVYSRSPIFAREAPFEEPFHLDCDPVLQYTTGRTVLPGMDHLRSVTARSAIIQYDRDIEELFYATKSFFEDCQDGECTCLDGKMHSLRAPGENFMLTDNDDDFGFSVTPPTGKDIFSLIDELVNVDIFDISDDQGYVSEEALNRPGVYFDIPPQNEKASMIFSQLFCPSTLDDAKSLVCDRENVSDTSDTDAESLSLTQPSELTDIDTDTHECINYTAFNELLKMEENGTRPVIHRDIADEDYEPEIGLAELVYLYPRVEGHATLLPLPNSSKLSVTSFEFNSGISRPPAPLQPNINLQPTVRQRCKPYGLYSSNRSQHLHRLPQLRLSTQLLPKHKPLSMVEEEERSCSSSSSPTGSLDFADHRGFVKPLDDRRLDFLGDDDEGENSSEWLVMPTSTPSCICKSLFSDAVWDSVPDLTLAQLNQESHAAITPAWGLPPSPLLESFEIEIHSRLTFMFNCMNSGRFEELPALSSDLHWKLCALANDYPALPLLRSLGVAIEILVERMVASTIAS